MGNHEEGDFNILKRFCAVSVKEILERQWDRKKNYVIKWKQ